MIDFANFPLISTWQPGVLFAMINRIGEPETGVPTRYCPISTQDSKPQFYAATNYGWVSSASQPLTWTANSPLPGPLWPFSPPSSSGLAVEFGTVFSSSPKVSEISSSRIKWGNEEMKILPHIWAEHILDLKKKKTKAVWKKIIWEKSLFGDIHGHDVVITRLMLCQTWVLEIICSIQKTLWWFRWTVINIETNFALHLFLRFFAWVSPRSVLLSGFLFRILNILNKFLSRHSFDRNKLLGQRTCFDDCSDVWVGPARPSLLGPEDARWQKLCVLFFFCAYKMHTFASTGTLLLSCDTLASTWHFSLPLSFLWVRLLWWHLRMLEAQDPLAIFLVAL